MTVICFGNPWHGDDGFGHHVFRRLHGRVAAVDAGTAGLNALHLFEGCTKAVIVDAVRTGGRVGTVHRLVPSDLEPPGGELSLHELGVAGVIAALREPPEIVLIGAEVGELRTFTDRLSPPLRAALPTAVDLVLRECAVAQSRERVVERGRGEPAATSSCWISSQTSFRNTGMSRGA